MAALRLCLSLVAGGSTAVDFPWLWVDLGVSNYQGPLDSVSCSCNQADAALHEGQYPAEPALSMPPTVSSSPPNKPQPKLAQGHGALVHKDLQAGFCSIWSRSCSGMVYVLGRAMGGTGRAPHIPSSRCGWRSGGHFNLEVHLMPEEASRTPIARKGSAK